MSHAEKLIILEMFGASLSRFEKNDVVYFTDFGFKTQFYIHQKGPFIIVKPIDLQAKATTEDYTNQKIKIFSPQEGMFYNVMPFVLKHASILVSDGTPVHVPQPILDQLITVLTSSDTKQKKAKKGKKKASISTEELELKSMILKLLLINMD
jgi:hypothetical protein